MTKDAQGNEISLPIDYAGNPILRALIRLIPHGIGSAADVLIMDKADGIKKARIRTFFDELAAGKAVLTPELIEKDDFIHSLDATMRAAFRARRDEKIKMFARLLHHGAIDGGALSPDDYEELVFLLDDLSYREWSALVIFKRLLDSTPMDENPLSRVQPIWPSFIAELHRELAVPDTEASSFMIGISRTGLFSEITGAYWDYAGGLGITTPKFDRFRLLVEARNV